MNFDPLSHGFVHLVPMHRLPNGKMRYRCTRTKPDGTVCGATRDLEYRQARNYSCCEGCGRLAKSHANRRRKKILKFDLTPEQRERYLEILRGREGGDAAREAIEQVLIETKNAGAHCAACARKYGK